MPHLSHENATTERAHLLLNPSNSLPQKTSKNIFGGAPDVQNPSKTKEQGPLTALDEGGMMKGGE